MTKNVIAASVRTWLLFGALLAVIGCASGQSSANAPEPQRKFVFAPRVGLVFRHEMKNTDEFAIVGSSFRDAVERRFVWEVTVGEQGGNYTYKRRLVQLGLTVNGM